MSENFVSLSVNTLDEFSFIAGTPQILTFDICDSSGSPIDISATTCSVAFSPYGQSNYLAFTAAGAVSGSVSSRFTVTLEGDDTSLLGGKYSMQPIILDIDNEEYRPAQGLVLIIPKNYNA